MIAVVSSNPVVTQIVPAVADAVGGTVISFQNLARAREVLQMLRLAMRLVIVDTATLEPDVERSLRTIEELDLPLVLVSTEDRRDLLRRGVHLGDRTFVTVPCSGPQIVERFEHATRRPSLLDRLRRARRGSGHPRLLV